MTSTETGPRGIHRVRWRDILFSAACGVFVTAGLSLAFMALGTGPGTLPYIAPVTMGGLYLGTALAVHFFVVRRRGVAWREIGFRRVALRWYGRAGFVLLAWWALGTLIYQALGLWDELLTLERSALLSGSPGWLPMLLMFVAVGPFAAILEETLFRGLIFGRLRVRHSLPVAALLSAGLFAVLHFYFLVPNVLAGTVMTVEIFLIGIVFAVLFERCGSLWPGIVLHAVNNVGAVGYLAYA